MAVNEKTVVDFVETTMALMNATATPEQQREAATVIVLMKELDCWRSALRAYSALKVSGRLFGAPDVAPAD